MHAFDYSVQLQIAEEVFQVDSQARVKGTADCCLSSL